MQLIRDLTAMRKDLTTYSVGLLQARTYRTLKSKTDAFLKPYKISSTDWAYLGVVSEHADGLRLSELASILGVEAPLVTSLSLKFEKRRLITYRKDMHDSRAKYVLLTDKGTALVREIEPLLRRESKRWLSALSIPDIITYIKILKKISSIGEK